MPEPVSRTWLVPLLGGLAAGFLAGLFGIGGGVLLVPILVLLLHRSQHVAHATSLVAIVIPSAAAAGRFALDGAVNWWGAGLVAVASLVGVQVGALIAHRTRERPLRWAFTVLLTILTVQMLLVGDPTAGEGGTPSLDVASGLAHLGLGLVVGTLSALLGIGGGAVIVPVLSILLGYGQHLAEGTSLAVILPTALLGATTHARRGYTEWGIGWRLGIGGLLGALGGAQLALTLSPDVLARAFGGLLALVTANFVRRSLRAGGSEGSADGEGTARPPEDELPAARSS